MKGDEHCCTQCALELPCEEDCPDHPDADPEACPSVEVETDGPRTGSELARIAALRDRPLTEPQPSQRVLEEILREVRAPVFEGKPFSQEFASGALHLGVLKWPVPARGYRPQLEAIRMCRGDNSGTYGPTFPFELSIVPYGISARDAELTIDKGLIVRRSLACFAFNGGSFSSSTATEVVLGGPPYRIPYDAQSGRFNYLFYKLDLTGLPSPNPARLVIHDRWVPSHEVFPPGTGRRPPWETV